MKKPTLKYLSVIFDNLRIKGYTPEYDNVIQQTGSHVECKNGLEFQLSRIGVGSDIGMQVTNLIMSDFGSACSGSPLVLNHEFIKWGDYQCDSRDLIRNITFEGDNMTVKKINLKDGISLGADSVAIQDLDGSLNPNGNGRSGFIASD